MFNPLKNMSSRLSPFMAILLLSACGGGGSSDDGNNPVTVATTVKPGAYLTTIKYASGGVDEAATFLSSSGKFVSLISEVDGTFGTLTFRSDDTFSGTLTDVFFDGTWQSLSGSVEGNVIGSEELTGTATASGLSSDITLTRVNAYSDLGVTMQDLSGNYVMTDTVSTAVTVTSDGALTGQDDTGCTFNGNVSIPDTTYNIFEVVLSVANCGDIAGGASGALRDGDYQGIGAYDPDLKELEFAGTDGDVVAVFIGVK